MRTSDDLRPPYRWDLVTPDQLGSLLDGAAAPQLWFLDELAACTGRVLARSGGGDLYFVGRSLDSMYDLLSGALRGVAEPAIRRLPLSFGANNPLTPQEVARFREELAAVGLHPHGLARRRRPATLVDVVCSGDTFTDLYAQVRRWIADEGESWPVIRHKLRFVGVTDRVSHDRLATDRWQQHRAWTRELPGRAVMNVSMHRWVWGYLANNQAKLTRTYPPDGWVATPRAPDHGERTRAALAEAVAIVAHGRTAEVRRKIAHAMADEPALAESWLRTLRGRLTAGGPAREETSPAAELPEPPRATARRRLPTRRPRRRAMRRVALLRLVE
jgi:hypothetical protein